MLSVLCSIIFGYATVTVETSGDAAAQVDTALEGEPIKATQAVKQIACVYPPSTQLVKHRLRCWRCHAATSHR